MAASSTGRWVMCGVAVTGLAGAILAFTLSMGGNGAVAEDRARASVVEVKVSPRNEHPHAARSSALPQPSASVTPACEVSFVDLSGDLLVPFELRSVANSEPIEVGVGGKAQLGMNQRYRFESSRYGACSFWLGDDRAAAVVALRPLCRVWIVRNGGPEDSLQLHMQLRSDVTDALGAQPESVELALPRGIPVTAMLPFGSWVLRDWRDWSVRPRLVDVRADASLSLDVGSLPVLRGRVVDEGGNAVAGVDVSELSWPRQSCRSQADGSFVLTVTTEPVFVDAAKAAPGYEERLNVGPYRFGDTAEIIVTSADSFVFECYIDGVPPQESEAFLVQGAESVSLVTEGRGSFRLPQPLRNGDAIRIRGKDRDFLVDAWQRIVDRKFRRIVYRSDLRCRDVTVAVSDLSGRPVAEAAVVATQGVRSGLLHQVDRLQSMGVAMPGIVRREPIRTSSEGRAVLGGIIGDALVTVTAAGFDVSHRRLEVTESLADIRMPRMVACSGRVLLADGFRRWPVQVRALVASHGAIDTAVAIDGTFALAGLPEGSTELRLLSGPGDQPFAFELPTFVVPQPADYIVDLRHMRLVHVVLGPPVAGRRALQGSDDAILIPTGGSRELVRLRDRDGVRSAWVLPGRYWLQLRGVATGTGRPLQVTTSVDIVSSTESQVVASGMYEEVSFLDVRRGGRPAGSAWLQLPNGELLSCSPTGRATLIGTVPEGYPVQVVDYRDGAWFGLGLPMPVVTTDSGLPDQVMLRR